MVDGAVSGLNQQLLNDNFRLFIFAFTELMMSNMPSRIDEVEGRPILVVEGAPYSVIIIDGNRIIDAQVLRGSANAIDVLLEFELGRVHADHHQSLIPVFLGPRADIGERAQPIDASIVPEF